MRFHGRVALVTGGAQGMGKAIAERLADEGASVALLDSDEQGGARAAADIGARTPGTVLSIVGDVSSRSDVHHGVAACIARFGRLDVLVAQAGVAGVESLLDIDDSSWARMLAVNLTGTFICVQEGARAMIACSATGSIVITSSTNAFFVEAHTAHYSATKGALITFARSAAMDLAPYGIRVNAVSPGIVRTRLSSVLTDDPVAGPAYATRIPLGRFGEPRDVAATVAFLASDDACYVTGANLVVDGGATIGVSLEIPDVPGLGAPVDIPCDGGDS